MEPEEVARRTMDGRQMFYSDYGHPEGVLADRDHDSPEEFKWWLFNYVHLGHPWETSVGNFNPGFLWKQGYNHKNVGYDKRIISSMPPTNGFSIFPLSPQYCLCHACIYTA